MDKLTFEFALPLDRSEPSSVRSGSRVFTHKGEWMQGPIPVTIDSVERYTMGILSLLDKLNSAYVDVRKSPIDDVPIEAPFEPIISISPNGWNSGEVSLVRMAVMETWRQVGYNERCVYNVYGYHDIRVGAGSGSSSALVQAAIRATALEHNLELSSEQLVSIHSAVERGADPLHLSKPAVVGTRVRLKGPIRPLGDRTPKLQAVTWSAGEPVRTTQVKFEYDYNELLLWRVRWASMERAVRSDDVERVACLAAESARENEARNPKVDMKLLETAIEQFGALGFSVAHTGTYHTALFRKDTNKEVLQAYKSYVFQNSLVGRDAAVQIFDTADAAEKRWRDD